MGELRATSPHVAGVDVSQESALRKVACAEIEYKIGQRPLLVCARRLLLASTQPKANSYGKDCERCLRETALWKAGYGSRWLRPMMP